MKYRTSSPPACADGVRAQETNTLFVFFEHATTVTTDASVGVLSTTTLSADDDDIIERGSLLLRAHHFV
jgi:hypothetical protein